MRYLIKSKAIKIAGLILLISACLSIPAYFIYQSAKSLIVDELNKNAINIAGTAASFIEENIGAYKGLPSDSHENSESFDQEYYKMKSMKDANCIDVMEYLICEKIVIGISAGSIIMQNNINLIAQYSPEMNDEVNLLDLSGFGFTNIEILPHYNKYSKRFERFEERAKEYEKTKNRNVIRINDGQGIIANMNDYTLI